VGRAPALVLRCIGVGRPVAEIVDIHLAFASAGLQPGLRPGRPRKGSVPKGVAGRAQRFGIRTTRIGGQNLIGILAIAGSSAGQVGGGRDGRDEKGALIGIGADQDRRIVVMAGLVELILAAQEREISAGVVAAIRGQGRQDVDGVSQWNERAGLPWDAIRSHVRRSALGVQSERRPAVKKDSR
jgi:hypothetical protein